MKKDMPLEGLRWSRDSGSALYDTPKTAVLGRAGGGKYKGILTRLMLERSMTYRRQISYMVNEDIDKIMRRIN